MKDLVHLLLLLLSLKISTSEIPALDPEWQLMCPDIYPYEFKGYAPRGNSTSGTFQPMSQYTNLKHCIAACCERPKCNIILMYNNTCYHVSCNSNKLCTPIYRPDKAGSPEPLNTVLVKPVDTDDPWSNWVNFNEDETAFQMDAPNQNDLFYKSNANTCEDGAQDCRENEICVKQMDLSGDGTCQCAIGYKRNSLGICKPMDEFEGFEQSAMSEVEAQPHLTQVLNCSVKQSLNQLLVSVVLKEVRLPENEVTLSAYTIPAEPANEPYNYVWSLLSQPEGQSGTMTDQNRITVKLNHLSEGLYMFKVAVSSPHAYGEAYANVSVLPPKRVNQAPIAVISPASQVVELPNRGAVLDGSTSTDDTEVISYHWELQQGPIGYQLKLLDTPTLQLDNLIAGNYTFKLTVEDSDHVTNFTTANITVLEGIDYPPIANAGPDMIVYLPQNKTTLNGSLSTDDRGITSWKWTQSPSDQNPADMQNTRTPYLWLSYLEEGMYTFFLEVMDESEQSSTAEVHVLVKPPTNKPPEADPGKDVTIAPQFTQTILNGSRSEDDNQVINLE